MIPKLLKIVTLVDVTDVYNVQKLNRVNKHNSAIGGRIELVGLRTRPAGLNWNVWQVGAGLLLTCARGLIGISNRER